MFNLSERPLSSFAEWVITMSNQTIRSNRMFRVHRLKPKTVGNEIKCSICENGFFKVERIAPEQILLICENCGEIHGITPDIFDQKMLYLKFCTSDKKK